MEMIGMDERRRAPRTPFFEPIMIRTRKGALLRAVSVDLSELGMLLHGSERAASEEEQPLWLTFTLPKVPHVVQVKGEVVRELRQGSQVYFGVQFLELPEMVRSMLRTYVSTGRAQVEGGPTEGKALRE